MKLPYCPESCLFDPDDERPGLKETCAECHHRDDRFVDPYEIVLKDGTTVTVLGFSGQWVYIVDESGRSDHATIARGRI